MILMSEAEEYVRSKALNEMAEEVVYISQPDIMFLPTGICA